MRTSVAAHARRHLLVLVVPDPPTDAHRVRLPPSLVGPLTQEAIDGELPWQTVPGYDRGAVPLSFRPSGPRLSVTICRVLGNFMPEAQRMR